MNVKLFADTNILVYAFDRGEPTKQVVAQELLRREGATGNIAVSTQVLQEFYVVVTRKLTVTLPLARNRSLPPSLASLRRGNRGH